MPPAPNTGFFKINACIAIEKKLLDDSLRDSKRKLTLILVETRFIGYASHSRLLNLPIDTELPPEEPLGEESEKHG